MYPPVSVRCRFDLRAASKNLQECALYVALRPIEKTEAN